MIIQHLRVRGGHALCGAIQYQTVARGWVDCPKCQRIIAVYHPDVPLSSLFAYPRIKR